MSCRLSLRSPATKTTGHEWTEMVSAVTSTLMADLKKRKREESAKPGLVRVQHSPRQEAYLREFPFFGCRQSGLIVEVKKRCSRNPLSRRKRSPSIVKSSPMTKLSPSSTLLLPQTRPSTGGVRT